MNGKCFYCDNNPDDCLHWEQLQMSTHGWYIHVIDEDDDAPNHYNAHTHGLKETFGHPDLQICLPLPTETVVDIFHLLVRGIKKGISYLPDRSFDDVLEGYEVKFIQAKECDRDVLRLLLPNKYGTYSGDIFEAQFTMLEHV